ncbi:hypothetical protein MiAbW_02881 [Microcystis aeruginosa NIES-4325]|uniref:Uncharacterized protein n=1 Tax=Microcystis aeruginosa NIES-4325 TaxID=2569534 RepID=A0A5J4FBC3_MICAE|nr:hypothetical protein MiAbW_02881 [Microcystis aeruginosa NIES-4325]
MIQSEKFFSQKYLSLNLEVTPSLGFTFLVQLLELMIDLEVISPTPLFPSIPDFPDNY